MLILSRNRECLTLIYNSNSKLGKRVLNNIKHRNKKVEPIDLDKERLSNALWMEIKDLLDLPLYKIFTYSSDSPIKKGLSEKDWLNIINNNPDLLHKPIALTKNNAKIISSQSEIPKLI